MYSMARRLASASSAPCPGGLCCATTLARSTAPSPRLVLHRPRGRIATVEHWLPVHTCGMKVRYRCGASTASPRHTALLVNHSIPHPWSQPDRTCIAACRTLLCGATRCLLGGRGPRGSSGTARVGAASAPTRVLQSFSVSPSLAHDGRMSCLISRKHAVYQPIYTKLEFSPSHGAATSG
jgi:hypothetical protein